MRPFFSSFLASTMMVAVECFGAMGGKSNCLPPPPPSFLSFSPPSPPHLMNRLRDGERPGYTPFLFLLPLLVVPILHGQITSLRDLMGRVPLSPLSRSPSLAIPTNDANYIRFPFPPHQFLIQFLWVKNVGLKKEKPLPPSLFFSFHLDQNKKRYVLSIEMLHERRICRPPLLPSLSLSPVESTVPGRCYRIASVGRRKLAFLFPLPPPRAFLSGREKE